MAYPLLRTGYHLHSFIIVPTHRFMADYSCSDCGRAYHTHIRPDGLFECPPDASISGPLCQRCHQPMGSHIIPDGVSVFCPPVRPLLPAPDKQPSQRRSRLRCSALNRSSDNAVGHLRRSTQIANANLRRSRAEPYAHAEQARRSHRTADNPIRKSRPRRVSARYQKMQNSDDRCSCENEPVYPARQHESLLQPYVLDSMVPAEEMDPIDGFRPFTEIDPGQLSVPVTVREPMRDLAVAARPPFEFVWNPSVVIPEVGGMRVRTGQFERVGRPAGDTVPSASSSAAAADENGTDYSMSGTEDYFPAQDRPSYSTAPEFHLPNHTHPHAVSTPTFPGLSQTEFTQGPAVPLQQHALASGSGNTYSPLIKHELAQLAQFDALVQHYAATQNQERQLAPLQTQQPPPGQAMGSAFSPSTLAFDPFPQPGSLEIPCPQQTPLANAPLQNPPFPPCLSSAIPGTLPDATITDTDTSNSSSRSYDRMEFESPAADPSLPPDRDPTEPAVDEYEDRATLEPWEYVHRVLTSSVRKLVMLIKMSTADVSRAASAAQGASLSVLPMTIDNEHWLLVGPRDVSLSEFGVKFQERATSPDKLVFRFGFLNWGAKADRIEDEVYKAVESSRRTGEPAKLPALFMTGDPGGLVIWYALSFD